MVWSMAYFLIFSPVFKHWLKNWDTVTGIQMSQPITWLFTIWILETKKYGIQMNLVYVLDNHCSTTLDTLKIKSFKVKEFYHFVFLVLSLILSQLYKKIKNSWLLTARRDCLCVLNVINANKNRLSSVRLKLE